MTVRWNIGKGTAAALRHVCPHCDAAVGVRCTRPGGQVLRHVHSKRMQLAAKDNAT